LNVQAGIDIRIDCGEIERELRGAPKQIPFAISKAINEVALKARDTLRADLGSHLTLRNAYTLNGLQVEKGSKATLDAKVGELDSRWYMASHALGEEARKPPKGVNHVPQEDGEGAPRPVHNRPIPRGLRIDKIDKSKHGGISYFVFRRDGKAIGMFYRSGAERPARRKTMRGQPVPSTVRPRLPITKAYTFASEVRIRPDWPMERIVAAVVERDWSQAVQKAVIEALWSAK
jgi:hypothetical protein